MATAPAYYELSWAILSTIGLTNTIFSIMVLGITSASALTILPIIVSAACAVANGMCYFAFYANYPLGPTVAASVFADIFWLIQEAGLPFYSYFILTRVLRGRARTVFLIAFWLLVNAIALLRLGILVTRVQFLVAGSPANSRQQELVSSLHTGYFAAIAVVELLSSGFLLRKFAHARRFSKAANNVNRVPARVGTGVGGAGGVGGLFRYLMRSTEVRVALLGVIGVTRAVTYSFQSTAQSAESVAGQLDRFAYTLECVFPTIMLIDILASKLAFSNDVYGNSSRAAGAGHSNNRSAPRHFTQQGTVNSEMYPMSDDIGRRIDIIAGGEGGAAHAGAGGREVDDLCHRRSGNSADGRNRTSSTERIVPMRADDESAQDGSDGGESKSAEVELGMINKTVEFSIRETHRGLR